MTQEEYDRYVKLAVEIGKLKGENTALREQLATTAELTALRAEVEMLTKERDNAQLAAGKFTTEIRILQERITDERESFTAERKAIAKALRAEFSDDFGIADRILAGEFAKEDK